MNDHSYWREWPLALFTVALQFACVTACTAAVLEWTGNRMLAGDMASVSMYAVISAISVSTLHLGRPHAAWRAFTNVRHSRLSREVWAAGMFMVGAVIYERTTYGSVIGLRLACSSLTAVLGMLALIANARVYHVPAQPHWRTAWLALSLFGLVLSGALLLPILR